MSQFRNLFVEFSGDPSNDKELYKRYCSSEKFEPLSLSDEVIHFVEVAALEATQKEIERLKGLITSFNASPKTILSDIQKAFNREYSRAEKLQLENKVLKEQLKLAESQIDDLKQQVDELNKAVYQENGED